LAPASAKNTANTGLDTRSTLTSSVRPTSGPAAGTTRWAFPTTSPAAMNATAASPPNEATRNVVP
jgi:hypothetical protein